MTTFLRHRLWPAIALLLALTVVTGVIYPADRHRGRPGGLPVAGQRLDRSSWTARPLGSSLIGQAFSDDKYLWGRPSAAGKGYDASGSAGTNLGPTDPRLVGFVPGTNTVGLDGSPSEVNPFATAADPYCVPTDADGNAVINPSTDQAYATNPDGTYVCYANTIPERAIAYRQANGLSADASVPVDLITTSASGLDPEISPAAAEYQVARVAAARGDERGRRPGGRPRHTEQPFLGFLGEPRVNVLLLNLDLDGAITD